MKALPLSILAAVGGFGLGFFGLKLASSQEAEALVQAPAAAKSSDAEARAWSAQKLAPGARMLGLAEKAATLSAAEWPAFFRAQLDSPESSRFAARLWAERDPAGFWKWLKEGRDSLLIDRFADDLVKTWAPAQPEEAMDALVKITDKKLGDRLRDMAIDAVIERDFDKAMAMAARAGDFNRFGWGEKEWMKKDPAAVVKGLGELPAISDFRRYLDYAVPIWAQSDPAAALEWMKSHRTQKDDDWVQKGFQAAAKASPQAALAAAREIADPKQRGGALAGVLVGGRLEDADFQALLEEVPLNLQSRAGSDLVKLQQPKTTDELMECSEALLRLPAGGNNLNAIGTLAIMWWHTDREAGMRWANSLPDVAMRRTALKALDRDG